MYKDFEDYSSEVDWNVEDNVHMIYDYKGVTKDSDKQIYISTWQSIYKQPKNYFKKFGFVIFDEVHQATADSVVKIMDSSVNAWIRAGFTGTLKSEDLHRLKVNGLFGKIKNVISTREMIDAGYASKLHIKVVILEYNESIAKEINRRIVSKTPAGKKIVRNNYANEINYITELDCRNTFIVNLVEALKGNVLVLFNKIEKHGKPLYKKLKKRLDNRKEIYYISGETKSEDREYIRNRMEEGDSNVLVASYGTLSTGVNIKNLKYVIFASPYKSEIKVLQSIGRVLRISDKENKAIVFDIVDDMRYKSKNNYCYSHFLKRLGMYKKEKFPMSVSKYKLIKSNNVC
jgi:superfamily II DNA or RNA helicase